MADITVGLTTFRVASDEYASLEYITGEDCPKSAGTSIIAGGRPVYIDGDGQAGVALATSRPSSIVAGIALVASTQHNPVEIMVEGLLDYGSGTLTKGEIYILSDTIGAAWGFISPVGDLASGQYTSIIGVAEDDRHLRVKIQNSGTPRA